MTYPRTLILLGVLLAGLAWSGCADEAVGPERPQVHLTQAQQQVVAADNAFGLKLFRRLSQDEGDANVFISPLSVSMALGMTLNGALGDTRTAIEQTLDVAGLPPDEINTAYRTLIDVLTGLDRKVRLDLPNSVWYRQSFAVEPAFLDANRTFFDAEVRALDFDNPEAAEVINGWVKDKTQGRIDRIVEPPISALTMLYLINAVYFRGDWTYRFDKDKTQDDTFRRADGAAVPVRMMTMEEASLPYLAGEGFQAVDLPYGDSLFSMTLFLPAEGTSLDTFVARLSRENWDAWTGGLAPTTFERLQMPRFKLTYEASLNDALAALGMDIAFDPGRADFGAINPLQTDLHVSQVKHKTFVEVDEKGTEAAAVTSVTIGVTSAPQGLTLRLDRPFVFAIREQATGAIVFIGKVTDPS